ncbi:hypothetical protein IQ13_2194 [Lacibacter cauensis]|uniref:SPW repeat-containing protein n=1 Tax=Lacibacter cauensis TaxID=510947 RepID=A0A562SJ32_9BACT|nr:DUF6804 family protein [Lacibacter cauensis]TWI81178.1 hypothetical protein IQ13_2194 [Lacibacter cauensis]
MKTLIKIALAVLFAVCLLNMPYGYYELVRFLGMVGFAVLAFQDRKITGLAVLWGSSALLINPFIKLALGRTLWNVVDVVWAVVLVVTAFVDYRNVTKSPRINGSR